MDPDVQAAKPDYLPQQRFIEYKKLNDTKEALHLRYPAGPEVLFFVGLKRSENSTLT